MSDIQSQDYKFSGTLNGETHTFVQRVYYEDTDFSGFVYHARYMHFMERARTEFIRVKGLMQNEMHQKDDPADSVAFVVGRIEIDYLKPAKMDNILTIVTKPSHVKGARMILDQEIFRGADDDLEKLTSAKVHVACINGYGRPRRLPDALL